jgi:hypothetical protein
VGLLSGLEVRAAARGGERKGRGRLTERRRSRKSKAPKPGVSLVFSLEAGRQSGSSGLLPKEREMRGVEMVHKRQAISGLVSTRGGCGRPLSTGKRRLAAVERILGLGFFRNCSKFLSQNYSPVNFSPSCTWLNVQLYKNSLHMLFKKYYNNYYRDYLL